jgi:hypothetical protein
VHLYRYFVTKSIGFCSITLCVASQLVFVVVRYRRSPETFEYTLVNAYTVCIKNRVFLYVYVHMSIEIMVCVCVYEGRLQSSWTHLITPSRNFTEVRWQSLFRSTSLGKRSTFTTLHPLLENVLQTVDHFEISCLGAPFSWFEKPRNRMGRDLNWILCSAWKKWIGGTPLEHPPYSSHLALCDFWALTSLCWGRIGGE